MRAPRDDVQLLVVLALETIWLASTWSRADGWLVALGGLLLIAACFVDTLVSERVNGVMFLVAATQTVAASTAYSVLHLFAIARWAAAIGAVLVVTTWWLIQSGRMAWVAPVLVIHAIAVSGLVLAEAPYPIDVYLVHQEAGRLIAAGADPYADLLVLDEVSAHYSITGYPYTPLTLFAYGGVAAVGGDPRWVGAAAWIALVAILAIKARATVVGLWILVLASIAQANAMTIHFAFSELFVAAVIIGSYALFQSHRNPWTALIYGASFGSKQHLGLAVPGAASSEVRRDGRWSTAALIAIGGLVTWGVGFFLSPGHYWGATVVNLAGLSINTEAASITGITAGSLVIPFPIVAMAPVLVGIFVGLKKPNRPLRAVAASVAAFLFLGVSAHWTHWTLVGWLISADLILENSIDWKKSARRESDDLKSHPG